MRTEQNTAVDCINLFNRLFDPVSSHSVDTAIFFLPLPNTKLRINFPSFQYLSFRHSFLAHESSFKCVPVRYSLVEEGEQVSHDDEGFARQRLQDFFDVNGTLLEALHRWNTPQTSHPEDYSYNQEHKHRQREKKEK